MSHVRTRMEARHRCHPARNADDGPTPTSSDVNPVSDRSCRIEILRRMMSRFLIETSTEVSIENQRGSVLRGTRRLENGLDSALDVPGRIVDVESTSNGYGLVLLDVLRRKQYPVLVERRESNRSFHANSLYRMSLSYIDPEFSRLRLLACGRELPRDRIPFQRDSC